MRSVKFILKQALVAFLLMIAATFLAWELTPKHKLVSQVGKLNLETAIPRRFGDWAEVPVKNMVVLNPQQQREISLIYTQTLARTYENIRTRDRVMLSIAYGENQSDATQMHAPEACYPAQGFQLRSNLKGVMRLKEGGIPVRRLDTFLGNQRHELVTYWIMIGEFATYGNLSKKITEMRYSLKGSIPDGLLFRVSNIQQGGEDSFSIHRQFVEDLYPHVPLLVRKRMISPSATVRTVGLMSGV